MENNYVLDTSAIFCLKDDAPGAEKVEAILSTAHRRRQKVIISFMTAMEYLYINLMRHGEEAGHKAYLELTLLPIEIVESDEDLRLIAAELKAAHNISLADSWIAATAKKHNATLVHRDPEFEPLKKSLDSLILPYK
ncbi:MAG: PIN domain-containing protein [Candidatus Margulisbacteria bacterium]|nr:PIN domain-containing protein [Candidatus Margulisiibacteriota bacterium]MBU1617181.1 PIN domain-containing protein [Candidatus Margulisiibacteriota bacterium]MBU1866907.1 PIN domain-containing protein [Candidatus Margulisiibacteriota bacterium]